jgi:glycosyltransferase involved in cell wall biosynthesis
MRICLLSSEHGSCGGIGVSVGRLSRLLAREHDVTVVHSYEAGFRGELPGDPPGLRHVVADPAALPDVAFASLDHQRSAAVLQAIEQAYGDSPPDYLEAPDYRGHALVPLQARNSHHRSLLGTRIAVRLRGMAELISVHDGDWANPDQRIVGDLEREALRLADHVLWPGGDVLDLYRRCLDPSLFEATSRVRLPFDSSGQVPAASRSEGPLRILYAGRMQRVKGVMALLEACLGLDSEEWRLTMIGADTQTAPLRQSMRGALEAVCAGDERVEIHDQLPRDELQSRFAEHDLLVVPSAFEVWPNVAMEAMRAGLPVLANPVGGLREIVADGVTGWWTGGAERAAIGAALERLLAEPAEVARIRGSGEVRARYEALGDEQTVLREYGELLGELCRPRETRRQPSPPPLVSGVVPYFGDSATVGEAVDSLLSQSHPELEVLVVDDGSFEAEDEVLLELASRDRVRVLFEPNRGEPSARNLAAIEADGKYLAFLDADNTYEPDFVARAVAMLEENPELAYVTCWLRYFDAGDGGVEQSGFGGFAALGNAVRSDESINSDGDAISVVPRRLLSELHYRFAEGAALMGDWEFYRRLRDDRRYGTVIPELLANYRVRRDSLSRVHSASDHAVVWEEARSRRRAALLEWVPGE